MCLSYKNNTSAQLYNNLYLPICVINIMLFLVKLFLSLTLWNVHCPEASLSGVEPLMQKVHNEIRIVDAEILTAVRQQVILCF